MFGDKHYIPILKGKEGEFNGLSMLNKLTKKTVTPLIDVPPYIDETAETKADVPSTVQLFDSLPPPPKNPKKSLDNHLKKVADRLWYSWGWEAPIFVDLFKLDPKSRTIDGLHPIKFIFNCLRSNNIQAIPTTNLILESCEDYNQAVAEVIKEDKRGVCIRIWEEDLEVPEDLEKKINKLLSILSISPNNSHIILDFKEIKVAEINNIAQKAINAINNLPNISEWKSLTLAGSGIPESFSSIKPDEIRMFPRSEYMLWTIVRNEYENLARLPSFGDYSIVHPNFKEFNKGFKAGAPKIRYTLDLSWLVLKGKLNDDTNKSSKQYHDMSRTLVNRDEFRGPKFSWGDKYIKDSSESGTKKRAGSTTWVAVGTNQHISQVANQLSSFGGF